jgi:hypothetical protein
MKRGRPPIGDKAMSTAERQRRFLDRIRGSGTEASSSQLEAEYAKLKAECTKLETECAKLKHDNTTLKRLLDGAHEHIRKMEARRERPRPQPKAKPPVSVDEEMQQKLTALRRKNAELRRRLQMVAEAPLGTVFLKQGDRRKILSALHPDGVENPAAKRRLEIAFQIINELFDKKKLREIEESD